MVITIATTVTTQACTRRVNGLVVMVKLICLESDHFLVLCTFALANALTGVAVAQHWYVNTQV